jgi:Zn-dependent M28 family amino/carboxypeptidase
VESTQEANVSRQRNRLVIVVVTVCVILAAAVTTACLARRSQVDDAEGDGRAKHPPTAAVDVDVDVDRVLGHLEALQQIADTNGGNRASGRPGYQASVDYVVSVLRDAGYTPELRELELPFALDTSELEQLAPDRVTYANGGDFAGSAFLGGSSDEAVGDVFGVDLVLSQPGSGNTSGCEAEDFAGFPSGSIALLQRGTCAFTTKVLNAQAAGASGAIVMNEGTADRTGVFTMSGDGSGLTIPVVGVTYDVGVSLATAEAPRVRLSQSLGEEPVSVTSVVAQTPSGNPDDVVMVGAHLDSVPGGAGINDNGSGSAALLALAEELGGEAPGGVELNGSVRFAWWAAEEDDLLGSTDYVETLSPEEADRIAAYLNVDMIASPNGRFEIYDGDGSGKGALVPVPRGSAQIEDAFQRFLTGRGLPYTDSALDGASDYVAFAEAGIPVGGLFTGADGEKTAEEVEQYGGLPGVGYDLCYHEPCDSLTDGDEISGVYGDLGDQVQLRGNVNVDILDVMTDALATVVAELAADTSVVDR